VFKFTCYFSRLQESLALKIVLTFSAFLGAALYTLLTPIGMPTTLGCSYPLKVSP
jgi:hypothetical protein